MSAKTLPQELIEHTIDIIHLDDVDHYFLSIVSRVAKVWRPRSQALIFREIIIADSLVLPGRLKTLLSRSPHLASCVQTLRLGDCGVDIVELCAICSSLTNVSELFLREIRLSSEHSLRSFGEFLTSLPSLSSLSIRECTLSLTVVQVVFHSCSSLKAISFKSCKDNFKPTPPTFYHPYCSEQPAIYRMRWPICCSPRFPCYIHICSRSSDAPSPGRRN